MQNYKLFLVLKVTVTMTSDLKVIYFSSILPISLTVLGLIILLYVKQVTPTTPTPVGGACFHSRGIIWRLVSKDI